MFSNRIRDEVNFDDWFEQQQQQPTTSRQSAAARRRRPHTNEKKAFVGTTNELEQALKEGYRVCKVFSALHFKDWSDKLFKGYVSDAMQIKTHRSGFEPGMTEEEQNRYIKEFDQLFGIKIVKNKMIKTILCVALQNFLPIHTGERWRKART